MVPKWLGHCKRAALRRGWPFRGSRTTVRFGPPCGARCGYRGRIADHSWIQGETAAAVTTTVLISVAISAAVTIALLLLRARSAVPAAASAVDDVVADLTRRMENLAGELAESLERTREESRRSHVLGELSTSIDLDEVLSRTLGAAVVLPNVDAAIITIRTLGGEPITRSLAISPEEAEEYALGAVPAGTRVRAVFLDYDGPLERAEQRPRMRAGIAVPIPGDKEPLGWLTVFSRTSVRPLDADLLAELEALGLRAGRAAENALRFRDARQQADIDPLTGLHTRGYFNETIAREVAQAQRYERPLALILFDIDDFKAINSIPPYWLGGDAVLTEVAARARDVVRHSDIACRWGGDEFALVLPESTLPAATQLFERIQSAVGSEPIPPADDVRLSGGLAQLRSDEDAETFVARAFEALRRAKENGKGRGEPE